MKKNSHMHTIKRSDHFLLFTFLLILALFPKKAKWKVYTWMHGRKKKDSLYTEQRKCLQERERQSENFTFNFLSLLVDFPKQTHFEYSRFIFLLSKRDKGRECISEKNFVRFVVMAWKGDLGKEKEEEKKSYSSIYTHKHVNINGV